MPQHQNFGAWKLQTKQTVFTEMTAMTEPYSSAERKSLPDMKSLDLRASKSPQSGDQEPSSRFLRRHPISKLDSTNSTRTTQGWSEEKQNRKHAPEPQASTIRGGRGRPSAAASDPLLLGFLGAGGGLLTHRLYGWGRGSKTMDGERVNPTSPTGMEWNGGGKRGSMTGR
jgi:hypothetical protein